MLRMANLKKGSFGPRPARISSKLLAREVGEVGEVGLGRLEKAVGDVANGLDGRAGPDSGLFGGGGGLTAGSPVAGFSIFETSSDFAGGRARSGSGVSARFRQSSAPAFHKSTNCLFRRSPGTFNGSRAISCRAIMALSTRRAWPRSIPTASASVLVDGQHDGRSPNA